MCIYIYINIYTHIVCNNHITIILFRSHTTQADRWQPPRDHQPVAAHAARARADTAARPLAPPPARDGVRRLGAAYIYIYIYILCCILSLSLYIYIYIYLSCLYVYIYI